MSGWIHRAVRGAMWTAECSMALCANPRPIRRLGFLETLREAADNGLSIARYGDGELGFVFHGHRGYFGGIDFQRPDPALARRLNEVLFGRHDKTLVCVNGHQFDRDAMLLVNRYKYDCGKPVRRVETALVPGDINVHGTVRDNRRFRMQWRIVAGHAESDVFGEASVFRLARFYDDYLRGRIGEVLPLYRKLIEGRHVVFVCPADDGGDGSFQALCRDGVIASPASVHFVEIPRAHAFAEYERIRNDVLAVAGADTAVIQGGPFATVLAADLAERHGLRAYDCGIWHESLHCAAREHGVTF